MATPRTQTASTVKMWQRRRGVFLVTCPSEKAAERGEVSGGRARCRRLPPPWTRRPKAPHRPARLCKSTTCTTPKRPAVSCITASASWTRTIWDGSMSRRLSTVHSNTVAACNSRSATPPPGWRISTGTSTTTTTSHTQLAGGGTWTGPTPSTASTRSCPSFPMDTTWTPRAAYGRPGGTARALMGKKPG